jgi:asparagine synthase (glutamine-hydrolysing)
MCGISGFFQTGRTLQESHLKEMTDIQAHRGPDAAGYYFNEICGLGHRRLSILDLSDAANQPFWSADGKAVMVYNGEIYNYQEIAADLGMKMRTTSDTEVILEAFLKWGPECVHRFNGMFAFAVFKPETDELFLCRDRMGIKPLYVYHQDGITVFSSELKGILALRPSIQLSLDKTAVRDYLHLGYVPEPLTISREVKKFPSGSYATVNGKGLHIKSYWQPEDQLKSEVISNEVEAEKELHELLLSSVRYRMISDVPFGTFLSGGIDSSLVTALAQNLSDKPVNTFSIGFKESKFNEAHYAKDVAKHLKTHHHEFIVGERDALELIDKMTDAYDEPFADSSSLPTMLVSKLARKHVTMTLSGDGGDELFLGYGSYLWAARMSNPFIRTFRKPIGWLLSKHPDNRFKRAANHFKFEDADRLRSHIFSQEIYYYASTELDALLKPAFRGGFSFHEGEFQEKLKRNLNVSEQQALFDLRFYLKDDLLTKVDRATMQFSLETRVPLLDYRIVSFALNLDPALKMKDGKSKYLLRKILFKYVPETLFDRPKWGFSIPLERWMENELSYLIDQYASREMCEKHGIIEFNRFNKYIQEFKSGRTYMYNRIWQVIVLHKLLDRVNLAPALS